MYQIIRQLFIRSVFYKKKKTHTHTQKKTNEFISGCKPYDISLPSFLSFNQSGIVRNLHLTVSAKDIKISLVVSNQTVHTNLLWNTSVIEHKKAKYRDIDLSRQILLHFCFQNQKVDFFI